MKIWSKNCEEVIKTERKKTPWQDIYIYDRNMQALFSLEKKKRHKGNLMCFSSQTYPSHCRTYQHPFNSST